MDVVDLLRSCRGFVVCGLGDRGGVAAVPQGPAAPHDRDLHGTTASRARGQRRIGTGTVARRVTMSMPRVAELTSPWRTTAASPRLVVPRREEAGERAGNLGGLGWPCGASQ